MTGKNVDLLNHIQDQVTAGNQKQKLAFWHCIVHREVLHKSVLNVSNVTDVVTKIVNFIRARALNYRQFVRLLKDHEEEHGDICYHTNVRWLRFGKVLQRVWDFRAEIREFCELKSKNASELSDAQWMADFAFAVGVTGLMNELNTNYNARAPMHMMCTA